MRFTADGKTGVRRDGHGYDALADVRGHLGWSADTGPNTRMIEYLVEPRGGIP